MIKRTRVLQFKQFDSDQSCTDVRLTAADAANGDTYVVIKVGGDDDTLKALIAARGTKFRVTIEEIG